MKEIKFTDVLSNCNFEKTESCQICNTSIVINELSVISKNAWKFAVSRGQFSHAIQQSSQQRHCGTETIPFWIVSVKQWYWLSCCSTKAKENRDTSFCLSSHKEKKLKWKWSFRNLQVNKMETPKAKLIQPRNSLYYSSNKCKKICSFHCCVSHSMEVFLIIILSTDTDNSILHCNVNTFMLLLHRKLPPLPGRYGCCSKYCYRPRLSGSPFLLSDSHSPTMTSLWRARPCFASASSRLPWNHLGYSECWKTRAHFIHIGMNTSNKFTAPW